MAEEIPNIDLRPQSAGLYTTLSLSIPLTSYTERQNSGSASFRVAGRYSIAAVTA